VFNRGDHPVVVGELAWEQGATSLAGRVGPEKRDARLTIRDGDGNVLAAWGDEGPCSPEDSRRRTASGWTRRAASTWPGARCFADGPGPVTTSATTKD
jgi:hypothetical protein